jgi:hypothetical protein
VLAHNHQNT